MKKIFIALLALISTTVFAQTNSVLNTVVIDYQGSQIILSWDEIMRLDYSSPEYVTICYNNGKEYQLNRKDIKNIQFRNTHSNPEVILKHDASGLYEGLFYRSASPHTTYYMAACLASDEMLGGGGAYDSTFRQLDFMRCNSSSFTDYWNTTYEYILKANQALKLLEFIPKEYGTAEVRHAKGETLFLRAYYYYELASMFGNVPLILGDNTWKERLAETTPEMVWGQIMLDLKNAIDYMDGNMSPTLNSDDSRVGRYAAEALLARCFLFYNGFCKGIHDIAGKDVSVSLPDGSVLARTNVVAYLEDCVKNSQFRLVSDYRNLWPVTNRVTALHYSYTNDNNLQWVENDHNINPEVLFKIKYNSKASWSTTIGYSNQYALYFGYPDSNGDGIFPFGYGWGAGTVSAPFYTEWANEEPNDMRRDASIQPLDALPNYSFGSICQETNYRERKIAPVVSKYSKPWNDNSYACFEYDMYHELVNSVGYNFQLNNIHPLNLLRYSDVLLMHSELTGTVDGINEVRKRANLAPLTSYSLEALQNERRWELAFEGVRWGDMRRWGDDYCKAALDKQEQEVLYEGTRVQNPLHFAESEGKTYSQLYSENRGFFTMPNSPITTIVGALEGNWTFGELNGICYGTMKYHHCSSAEFLNDSENAGLIKGYSLKEMKNLYEDAKGEISQFSYMSFSGYDVKKYDAMGKQIAEGKVSYTIEDDYDWKVCSATFSGDVVLYGYDANGSPITEVDVIVLDENTLVMVDAKNKTKDAEAVFWVFKRQTAYENYMHAIASQKWGHSNTVSKGLSFETGTYETYDRGTVGICSYYSGTNIGMPELYSRYIEGITVQYLPALLERYGVTDMREADPFAFMQFDLYTNTLYKYTSSGDLIASAPFETEDKGSDLRIIFKENSILTPYRYGDNGKIANEFYIRYTGLPSSQTQNPYLVFYSTDSYSDHSFDYWYFSPVGISQNALESAISILQYDDEGNLQEGGNNVHILVNGKKVGNLIVTCENTDITGSYGEYKIHYGGESEVTLYIEYINDNGIHSYATRTISIQKPKLSPLAQMLVGVDEQKVWRWDCETSPCWGNAGNTGNGSAYTARNVDGMWWGVNNPEELTEQLHHSDTGVATGEESNGAYMMFTDDGNICSYGADNQLIRSATFDIVDFYESRRNNWQLGNLVTSKPAILFPFAINGGGKTVLNFDIMYLDENYMTLVYTNGNGSGSWGEITFWKFKSEKKQ